MSDSEPPNRQFTEAEIERAIAQAKGISARAAHVIDDPEFDADGRAALRSEISFDEKW